MGGEYPLTTPKQELFYSTLFAKCPNCGREFLVERMITKLPDPTADILISCKECLQTRFSSTDPKIILELAEFQKRAPEPFRKIMEWLNKK